MNISSLLENNLKKMSDRTAIIESKHGRSNSITFAQFDQRSSQVAAYLKRQGIRQGHSVLILHPMSIELYTFLVALFKIGAVALFIDPAFGQQHIRQCFALCRPVASFICTKALLMRLLNKELNLLPLCRPPKQLNKSDSEFPICDLDGQAPALITFTSGSNGSPRAIVRSHAFLSEQLKVLASTLNLQAGQIDLTTLPIFLLANLAHGLTSVIPNGNGGCAPEQVRIDAVLKQIKEHKVTRTAASPQLLEQLCRRKSDALDSLRQIYTGGGPLYPTQLLALQRQATKAAITMVYGSTECEPIASIDLSNLAPTDLNNMLTGGGLLAGRPDSATKVRIESDNSYRSGTRSTAESCHSEEIGQILVTGSHVVKSYLGGSGDFETKTKIDGEIWHKTGDAGYFDEEGRLWLVGRYDRALSDKHGTLFPFQLEAAALKLPGVKRAAAVQFAGRRILVLQPENRLQLLFRARHLSQEALQRLLWARLDQVITVGVLPVDKRHNSKIDYPALISLLSSRRSLQRPNASTASASFCGSKIG